MRQGSQMNCFSCLINAHLRGLPVEFLPPGAGDSGDRKSTRLNSSHPWPKDISGFREWLISAPSSTVTEIGRCKWNRDVRLPSCFLYCVSPPRTQCFLKRADLYFLLRTFYHDVVDIKRHLTQVLKRVHRKHYILTQPKSNLENFGIME